MKKEQDMLAEIRTLMALERNYLAEERTAMAEFRTALALALIGPSISTIILYVSPYIATEGVVILIIFFLILTSIGIWISITSSLKLKKIRKKKRILKEREVTIIKNSKEISDLLGNLIVINE